MGQELLDDVKRISTDALKANVMSKKVLRTLVGKAVHISGLITTWKPFVRMLWAPWIPGSDGFQHKLV